MKIIMFVLLIFLEIELPADFRIGNAYTKTRLVKYNYFIIDYFSVSLMIIFIVYILIFKYWKKNTIVSVGIESFANIEDVPRKDPSER